MLRCIQANLNKFPVAQDYFLHHPEESGAGVGFISEPNFVQDRSAWRAVGTLAIQVLTAKVAAVHEAERGRGEEILLQRRRRSTSSSSSDNGDVVVPDGRGDLG